MESRTTARPLRTTLLACAAVVALLALTGCGILRQITGGGDDVFNLAVGDCIGESFGTGEVSSVDIVDCNEPHYGEVFASHIMEGDVFPGQAQADTTATEYCQGPAFSSFIGVEYASSAVYVEYLTPTAETWNEMNDREILCIGYVPGEDTVGTLQGSNR